MGAAARAPHAGAVLGYSDDLGVTDDPAKFDQAVRFLRRKVGISEDDWDELTEAEQQRAFKVAAVAQADLAQEVLDAITSAVEDGTTFEDFRDAVGEKLADAWGGEDSPRLEGIFRTNTMAAYNGGRYEAFNDPEVKEARPFWRFDAIEDDRIDDVCADSDGTVLASDDPWWTTHLPPLHPNCRCTFVALSDEEAQEAGLTPEPTEREAADGFGAPPASDDWDPDLSTYSDPIREALESRLANG
jgi:SPP1 gp7 family putative phage head morphogenesis protein